jgi:telomere length regulation protein
MIVGMGISDLVEPAGKAMKFDLEGFDGEETEWYLALTRVDDKIGSIQDLQKFDSEKEKISKPAKTSKPKVAWAPSSIQRESSKIVAIEEIIDDDDEDEEEEFMPYDKPDSDASDSEDDPTLVQRGKPTAPV